MFRREQHASTLVDYARRVESMGFDQLWVVEDCFYWGGIAQAAIALAATERLKVGVGINPAVARNPAFLAMEYATLAHAFPGRFYGGIGHGVAEWMEQIGAKPASWLQSIEEITSAVRRIMGGELVSVDSRYVHLDGVQLEQAPEVIPPVFLGVQGPKSVRLAGACADGILVVEHAAPAYVRWARSLMDEGREDAGQSGPGRVIVYANCIVDDASPATARQAMREITASLNGAGLQPTMAPVAFAAEMAALVEEGGADALRARMPDEWLHELAITGSHEDARAAVARFAEAGAEAVILVPPDNADWDSWLAKQAWATDTGTR
jgi:alkanesulfonate monooxygenase SsuD/methylene tetrahydromethanopterin reductase-like flavin-dependent oxidoreductase (luciferase family)